MELSLLIDPFSIHDGDDEIVHSIDGGLDIDNEGGPGGQCAVAQKSPVEFHDHSERIT